MPAPALRLRLFAIVALVGAFVLAARVPAAEAVISLTTAERAWLEAHPVIRVGYDPDFKPFCFRGADGALRGIDAELLAWIGSRLGVKFEARSAETWTGIYDAAVRRDVDMLTSTADVLERRPHFSFTEAYVTFPVTIVVRADGPFAVTHTDLRTMRIAAPRNYAATLAFVRTYPGIRFVECNTIEDALDLVSRSEADAAVTNLTNASYIIKTNGLTNLKIAGVLREFFELRLAVRSDWPELRLILDKALAAMPAEEMATILDHWVKVDYAAVIRWDFVRRWAIIGAVFAATVIGLVTWRNRSLATELARRRVVQQALEAANTRLNAANAELTRRHDEMGELMRVAAHDLRGPLTAIMLNAEMVRQSHPPLREIAAINAAAHQMKQLVDDLLDVHALEEGQRVFREEPVDVAAMARAAAAVIEPAAECKRIAIDVGGVEATPPVRADAGALRQVIDNLLSNALKFSPCDTSVAVSVRTWKEFVRIEVRDRGPGVPEGERERIFTKYARGTAQPTAGEQSTGLGLAIVRDLVTAMNGRVWCEAAPGGGAVFVVTLPQAAPGQAI